MSKDYNILAQHIVSKYSARISGRDIDQFLIGDNPSKRVMVGMLAENRVENSFAGGYRENTETRFESVPSISVTFVIKKGSSGSIYIIPRGLLFYTVAPDYERTVHHVLQSNSERDRVSYRDINELCEQHADQKFLLPKT